MMKKITALIVVLTAYDSEHLISIIQAMVNNSHYQTREGPNKTYESYNIVISWLLLIPKAINVESLHL